MVDITKPIGGATGWNVATDAAIDRVNNLPFCNVVTDGYATDKTGATSSAAGISAAIADVNTDGGGTVYLPPGVWMWNGTPPALRTGVTLKGAGLGKTKIYQNSNTAAGLTALDQKDMVIEDLSILGTEAGINTGISMTRSVNPDISGVTMRRVQVTGFQTSIDGSNLITSTFDRVLVDTGQVGFNVHGVLGTGGSSGTSVTFLNCYSAGFTQSGTRLDNMAYCAFVGCASDACGIAYELLEVGTQGIAFVGCGAESTVNRSTSYPGIAWKINGALAVSLDGCFTYDAVNTSIWVTGGGHAKVGGFSENTPQAAVTNSIKVDAGCAAVLEMVDTVKPVSLATGTTSRLKVNGNSDVATTTTFATPMDYSAVGDGTTDDTTAIQSAFDSGKIVLIDRPYAAGSLTASTGLTVWGTATGVLKRPAGKNYTISINPGSGGSSDSSTNIRKVTFLGVTFDDNITTNTFRQGDAQLNLNACSDVLVERCRFLGFRSDAIYLGSSNTASTERHNQRVKIVYNWFDGVNNDNRNAISIIDGEDVLIEGNSFINCTRSDMPGAIDAEPNVGNTFAVLRNIKIVNNTFRNVLGTAGVICLWLPIAQTSLTTTMRNLTVAGNTITDCPTTQGIFLQQSQTPTGSTAVNSFEFFGNTVTNCLRPFELGGLRGVRIHDNTFTNCPSGAAYGYQFKCRDVVVNNNVFSGVASTNGEVHDIYNVDIAEFSRNSYNDIGLTNGTYGVLHKFAVGQTVGASSFIDAVGNRVTGTGFTNFEDKSASHTLTAALNYAASNRRVNLTANTNTAITPAAGVWAAT